MPKLNAEQIAQRLKIIPDWKKRNKLISRTFEFKGFPESIRFVDRVARAAEEMNHHPDIDIRYNQVSLALVSHDAGGITDRDANMAQHIDAHFDANA